MAMAQAERGWLEAKLSEGWESAHAMNIHLIETTKARAEAQGKKLRRLSQLVPPTQEQIMEVMSRQWSEVNVEQMQAMGEQTGMPFEFQFYLRGARYWVAVGAFNVCAGRKSREHFPRLDICDEDMYPQPKWIFEMRQVPGASEISLPQGDDAEMILSRRVYQRQVALPAGFEPGLTLESWLAEVAAATLRSDVPETNQVTVLAGEPPFLYKHETRYGLNISTSISVNFLVGKFGPNATRGELTSRSFRYTAPEGAVLRTALRGEVLHSQRIDPNLFEAYLTHLAL